MKMNKETQALNDTLNNRDLTDIYRTFHPKTTEYNFFLSAYGSFSRIDQILGHKSSLGEFKKIEILSSIISTTTLWDKISIQGKKCKKHKHMEAKQYVTK